MLQDVMEVLKPGGKWWRDRKPPWRSPDDLGSLQALTSDESLAVAMRSSMEEFAFMEVKSRLSWRGISGDLASTLRSVTYSL